MTISSKKAQHTAMLALCLSVVFFVALLLLSAYWQILAVYILSWQILMGGLVWGVLVILFYHQASAEQEKLDKSRLSKSLEQETIFTGGGKQTALFEQAQKRLAFFEKWMLPVLGGLIAIAEITIGLLLYQKTTGLLDWKMQNPLLCAVLLALVAFISFLLSRYATGMSCEVAWRPLRAGGSYFLATSVLGFATAVALVFAQFKYPIGLKIVHYIVPWLLVILGAEILLNIILDFYRPRMTGQYNQCSLDSRLLGLINEPEGLFHSIAGAIDYQFGFQVSETWFYKLLEKAIFPLILFSAMMLYLMTSVVIVGPGQMGVIEHLGSPELKDGGRQIGSGLAFKWPWPFDKVYLYPADLIQSINIGFEEEAEEKENKSRNLLWGKEHYKKEYDLLVAATGGPLAGKQEDTVPVSIIRANIPILYRIKDVSAYLYNHIDPKQALETVCYRELTRFGVSATVETDESVIEKSLLGQGRLEASRVLQQRIQTAADDAGLGVEIVLCGLQGIHPPPKVVPDYQNVIAAVQTRQASVLDAIAEQNRVLTELAGSIDEVEALYSLVKKYSMSGDLSDSQKQEIASALAGAKGRVFNTIREAQAYAFEKTTLAEATGERFAGQLKAYHASPLLYKRLERLKVLEETLGKIRKYVVVADTKDSQVYIMDLQEKLVPSLYDMDVESTIRDASMSSR